MSTISSADGRSANTLAADTACVAPCVVKVSLVAAPASIACCFAVGFGIKMVCAARHAPPTRITPLVLGGRSAAASSSRCKTSISLSGTPIPRNDTKSFEPRATRFILWPSVFPPFEMRSANPLYKCFVVIVGVSGSTTSPFCRFAGEVATGSSRGKPKSTRVATSTDSGNETDWSCRTSSLISLSSCCSASSISLDLAWLRVLTRFSASGRATPPMV
mmetsp:Transcript_116204/g.248574  ORF Transcript_116204/g.248574 Transcript_116204/m.248574 type:complete len:218 (+) Transcript_116204:292-945(+)